MTVESKSSLEAGLNSRKVKVYWLKSELTTPIKDTDVNTKTF